LAEASPPFSIAGALSTAAWSAARGLAWGAATATGAFTTGRAGRARLAGASLSADAEGRFGWRVSGTTGVPGSCTPALGAVTVWEKAGETLFRRREAMSNRERIISIS